MGSTPAGKAAQAPAAGSGSDDTTGVDLTAVSAAAAQGAAQGAALADHIGLNEEQFTRLSTLTMNAAATAAAKVTNDLHERRRKADRLKDLGTTAAVSTVVFVAGTAAMVGYNKYRSASNGGDNRGRNEG